MSMITTFFDAWGMSDDAARAEALASVLSETARYADPRCTDPLQGPEAITQYVAAFAANAPGWRAEVVKSDSIAGLHRVTVAFGGTGPDGQAMQQLGQYVVEHNSAGQISRMTGFAGTGEPA